MNTHAMMTRSKSRAEAAARALLEAPNTCAHCDKQDGGEGEQFAYCDTVDGWLCPEHIKQGCRNCESCCDDDDEMYDCPNCGNQSSDCDECPHCDYAPRFDNEDSDDEESCCNSSCAGHDDDDYDNTFECPECDRVLKGECADDTYLYVRHTKTCQHDTICGEDGCDGLLNGGCRHCDDDCIARDICNKCEARHYEEDSDDE